MQLAGLPLAAAALVVGVALLAQHRDALGELRWFDWLTLLLFTIAGPALSLWAFDAIDGHAFRAHEEQLFRIFQGSAQLSDFHPAEVHRLIGGLYAKLGELTGGTTAAFVWTAIVLASTGTFFAGLAGRLATERWIGGLLPALLLTLNPNLAYWRVHGFHVGPGQVAFAACLMAAVLVARHGRWTAYAAWFVFGALAAYIRLEYAGAVAATALLPLLAGRVSDLKRVWVWAPALVVSAALFASAQAPLLEGIEQREDYRMGLRFVRLHVPVLAELSVGAFGGGLALLAMAAAAVGMSGKRAWALACLGIAGLGVLLPMAFIDFGMRHALPAATTVYVAAALGAAALEGRWKGAGLVASLVTCAMLAVPWIGDLKDLGSRYGREPDEPPTLPGVAIPEGDLPSDWATCALYSNLQHLCDTSPHCHPVKDMRDPGLVARRWDELNGCVYFVVETAFGEVSGVQHEWWPILSELYEWEPVGRQRVPNRGDMPPWLHMYRITERPEMWAPLARSSR